MFDPLLLSTKLVKPEYLGGILEYFGGGGGYCIISLFVMQGPQKFVQLLLFGSGFVVR